MTTKTFPIEIDTYNALTADNLRLRETLHAIITVYDAIAEYPSDGEAAGYMHDLASAALAAAPPVGEKGKQS